MDEKTIEARLQRLQSDYQEVCRRLRQTTEGLQVQVDALFSWRDRLEPPGWKKWHDEPKGFWVRVTPPMATDGWLWIAGWLSIVLGHGESTSDAEALLDARAFLQASGKRSLREWEERIRVHLSGQGDGRDFSLATSIRGCFDGE